MKVCICAFCAFCNSVCAGEFEFLCVFNFVYVRLCVFMGGCVCDCVRTHACIKSRCLLVSLCVGLCIYLCAFYVCLRFLCKFICVCGLLHAHLCVYVCLHI